MMRVSCRKGVYFRLDVYTSASDGRRLRRCSKQELKDQLLSILEQTDGYSPPLIRSRGKFINRPN